MNEVAAEQSNGQGTSIVDMIAGFGDSEQSSGVNHGSSGELTESQAALQPDGDEFAGEQELGGLDVEDQQAEAPEEQSGRTIEQMYGEFSRKFGNVSEQLDSVRQESEELRGENNALREAMYMYQNQVQQQPQPQPVDPFSQLDENDPDYEIKVLQLQVDNLNNQLQSTQQLSESRWAQQEAVHGQQRDEYERRQLEQQIHNSIETVVAQSVADPQFSAFSEQDLSRVIHLARDLAGSKLMELDGDLNKLGEVRSYVDNQLGFVANLTKAYQKPRAAPPARAPIRGSQQSSVANAKSGGETKRLTGQARSDAITSYIQGIMGSQ